MSNEKDLKKESKCAENKGDENMDAILNTGYKKLNINALNFSAKEVGSEEALKESTPIQWAKEILTGERKVVIKNNKE